MEEEGIVVTRVRGKEDKRSVIIITIYATRNWEVVKKEIDRIVEENKGEYIVIGGDFNARIGTEGGNDEEGWSTVRKSKDKVINNRGRELIDLVGEIGGNIMNGTSRGDREGEYTYIGERGSSTIDYIIVNDYSREIVNDFKVIGRTDSDHMPLVLELAGNAGREKRTKEREKSEEERWRCRWNVEDIKEYKKGRRRRT